MPLAANLSGLVPIIVEQGNGGSRTGAQKPDPRGSITMPISRDFRPFTGVSLTDCVPVIGLSFEKDALYEGTTE